ncbi:RelA/SpoT domain-containing protein [Vibrio sp. S4M6]|uniref:RelA/SpoT domain-containing protein n=1 Tax=Vibrio sinus TaxID=2946865 RepID=UPI002029D0A8|nr:RelA/SpoT domain-containing protein [Vibrio sinus]MCL9783424.1 RelA/SpoT domain-containing protein [Vibrio sinus]
MSFIFRTTAIMLLLLSRTSAFAATPTSSNNEQTRLPSQQQNEVCSKRFKHCLSGLYGIQNTEQTPLQPYNDFDQLYSLADSAQKELEIICASAALLTGTESIFSGTKSKQRAQHKIQYELNGQPERITDLARATIVADDVPSLVEAYEVLSRETTVVKVKNRFKNPQKSGYRDLNLLVQLPNSGLVAEVQLHLKAIANVKSGPEHDLYEQIQRIERRANEQERPLTELESAQIANIRKVSKELYQQAWQPYITTHIQAA